MSATTGIGVALALAMGTLAHAQCTPQWLPGIGGAASTLGGGSFAAPIYAATTMPNGDLVVGGGFGLMGGVAAGGIASWNGSWSAFGATNLNPVRALAVLPPYGDLVAAGDFASPSKVGRWNGSTWVDLGSGIRGTSVNTMAIWNGWLVVGGSFTTAGGSPASNLALWTGSSWMSLGGGTNGVVNELRVLQNGDLVVGGDFTMAGGVAANDLARWNGTTWSAFGSGLGGSPSSVSAVLELANGDLVVGGNFTSAGGLSIHHVAKWNGSWQPMGAMTFGGFGHLGVQALQQDFTGTIFAGGMFGLGGLAGTSLAHWTGSGWVQDQIGSSSTYVEVLHRNGSTLVVGGFWQGVSQNHSLSPWGCSQLAAATSFGSGCGEQRAYFYEHFTVPPGQFDLGQSTLRFTFDGSGYQVQRVPGAPAWSPPTSAALPLVDDSLSGPQVLGFNFPYLGGSGTSTALINISSNGRIYLGGTAGNPSALAFYNNINQALGSTWLLPLYGDWDPSTGTGAGTIHFHVDPIQQIAYVTWQGVQVYGQPGNTSTFQVALFSNGDIEYRYQNCTLGTVPALTGIRFDHTGPTSGIDISATPLIELYPPRPALAHSAPSRPILGTSTLLVTNQLSWVNGQGYQSSPLGGTILSTTQYNPGVSLSALGAPGCSLLAGLDVLDLAVPAVGLPTSGLQITYSLTVPNHPALAGQHVYSQGYAFMPGFNAFNTVTSNGLDLLLGYQ